MLSKFTRLPDRQTDERTDRILIARPRLHSMRRGKNVQRDVKHEILNFLNAITFKRRDVLGNILDHLLFCDLSLHISDASNVISNRTVSAASVSIFVTPIFLFLAIDFITIFLDILCRYGNEEFSYDKVTRINQFGTGI